MKIKYLYTFIILTSIYFVGCLIFATLFTSVFSEDQSSNLVLNSHKTRNALSNNKTIVNSSVSPVVSNQFIEFSNTTYIAVTSILCNIPPPSGLKATRNDDGLDCYKFETIAKFVNNIKTFTDKSGGMTGGHLYLGRIKVYSNLKSSYSNIAFVRTLI